MPASPSADIAARDGGDVERNGLPATPTFTASIWKRDVVREEPILLKLEVSNPGHDDLRIVAPYFNTYGRINLPLTLTVTDSSGRQVPNGWSGGGTGSEPILRGRPWWIPEGPAQAGHVDPQTWRAWSIPAGKTAFMWHNIRQYYPIDEPGEYHVVLHYLPSADMAPRSGLGEGAPPGEATLWTGSVEIDAGTVSVSEPGERDVAAADRLAQHREVQGSVFSTTLGWGDDAGILQGKAPWVVGTVYETYARFGRAFAGRAQEDASKSRSEAPAFPLWGLLDVVPLRSPPTSRTAYIGVSTRMRELRADPSRDPARLATLEESVRRSASEAIAAADAYVAAAIATGDYSILGHAQWSKELIAQEIRSDFPAWPD